MKTKSFGEWFFSEKNAKLSAKIAYTLAIVVIIGLSILMLIHALS